MNEASKLPTEEEERYHRAKAKAESLRTFYKSVFTYVWVNILLVIINLYFSPRSLWFYWVTIIWGFVLIAQAIKLFTVKDRFLGEEWERKKIQEFMEKDRHSTKKDQ